MRKAKASTKKRRTKQNAQSQRRAVSAKSMPKAVLKVVSTVAGVRRITSKHVKVNENKMVGISACHFEVLVQLAKEWCKTKIQRGYSTPDL
jgi:hypothetical protein